MISQGDHGGFNTSNKECLRSQTCKNRQNKRIIEEPNRWQYFPLKYLRWAHPYGHPTQSETNRTYIQRTPGSSPLPKRIYTAVLAKGILFLCQVCKIPLQHYFPEINSTLEVYSLFCCTNKASYTWQALPIKTSQMVNCFHITGYECNGTPVTSSTNTIDGKTPRITGSLNTVKSMQVSMETW